MKPWRESRTAGDGALKRIPCRAPVLTLSLLATLAGGAEPQPPVTDAPSEATAAMRREVDAAELRVACDDAAFLLAAGRAREARGRLEPLLPLVSADHPLHVRGRAIAEAARAAELREDDSGAAAIRLTAADEARQRAEQEKTVSSTLRAERIARIRDLQVRGHRELALAQLRSLLHDLPGDDEIDAMFRVLLDETHAARTTVIAERERELRAELALRIERSLIPEGFDGRPMYPSDWLDRRRGRNSLLDAAERIPTWQQAIADRLAARVTVSFEATPVAEAIDAVSKLSGTNIIAAPELLAATDRLITMRVASMRLEDVLTWIAEQAGTRWSLANGAVFIGDAAQGATTIALHDLGELLVGFGDFPGVRLELAAGSGGGAPGGLLNATASAAPPATADDVADLIRRSVSPNTWTNEANSLTVRGNALLVTAPPETQRLIREFLRAQSAQRALAVRVDARWLELNDSYVEEIGVQWTNGSTQKVITGGNAGLVRSVEGWAVDGSVTNALPGTAMSIQPATAGTGLNLQSALLGSSRISAILSAVERNGQGRTLKSPELTCLNGQLASAFFGQQMAYISDYEVVSGSYDPVITVLNTGATLEVRPLVSADRKYILLELHSAISSAQLYTESIRASTSDNNNNVLPTAASFSLELPNVSIRTTGTSVMLPDRGSILVGGFNASLDQFTSSRVPLLGSIPFLGRLFGARGRYSNKSQLYLLTTATIINYPELEARL